MQMNAGRFGGINNMGQNGIQAYSPKWGKGKKHVKFKIKEQLISTVTCADKPTKSRVKWFSEALNGKSSINEMTNHADG